jgi:hypothetical protein
LGNHHTRYAQHPGIGSKFYLASGTALARQLGHRLSVDLDFFASTEDIPTLRPALEKALASNSPTLADSAWGNLVYLARDVRIGFYGYGYEIPRISLISKLFPANCNPYFKACVYLFMRHSVVAPLAETREARLASVEDIALMKLDALLARAARKDFYDLYFICQKISLRTILAMAPQKYPSVRDFEAQTVKRLVYFENADQDIDPVLLSPVTWGQVKDYFIKQSKDIAANWLT